MASGKDSSSNLAPIACLRQHDEFSCSRCVHVHHAARLDEIEGERGSGVWS
jgi:hypothetical protein